MDKDKLVFRKDKINDTSLQKPVKKLWKISYEFQLWDGVKNRDP
jgi:hypothetical protein